MAFNSNPGKQQFSASAGQTVFTFNFAIFTDTDVKVYRTLAGAVANDATDILLLSTDYIVSINGTVGGTVTLISSASINDTITISRSLPVSRNTDYVTNGDLYADTLDLDQDYQTYLTLDQKQKWERSVVLPDTYSGSQIDFPVPSQYKFIRWNLAEDGFENVDPSTVLSSSDAAIINNVTDFLSIDTSVYTTAIVKDLDRGGTFIWSATGTANGGTVFAGATGYWTRQYSGAVNVKWFGAKGDGVNDDTLAIQSAINYGATIGGYDIFLQNGNYVISSTLDITSSNIKLIGQGSSEIHDAGSNGAYPVIIKWIGDLYGKMIFIHTIANINNSKINGCGVVNIKLDANNLANNGIHLQSHNEGTFERILFLEFLAPALLCDTLITGTDILEAADNQDNYFKALNFRQLINSGHCMYLSGSSNANTSFNTFEMITAQHINTTAFIFDNCDNNVFTQLRAIRPSGTIYSFALHGTTASGSVGGSSNLFQDCSYPATNGCIIRGTTSGYTDGIRNNYFFALDNGNGSGIPTVETGSYASGSFIDGTSFGQAISKLVVANSMALALSRRSVVGNESLRVYNSSSNHMIIEDSTNSWGVNINGANGDLRFLRFSGGGLFNFTFNMKVDGGLTVGNHLYPITDNTLFCGISSNRWSTIYAGTGTINTSDERVKTFLTIEDAEMQCAKELKTMIRKYKFNDAIESKGKLARIHYGVGAQSIIAKMQEFELDAMEYGFVCYDEWEEQIEVIDNEGKVTQPYIAAGNRYGIRYEELLCFIISAM